MKISRYSSLFLRKYWIKVELSKLKYGTFKIEEQKDELLFEKNIYKYVVIYQRKCYICSHNIIKTTDEYIQKIIVTLLGFASAPSEYGYIFDAEDEHRQRGALVSLEVYE